MPAEESLKCGTRLWRIHRADIDPAAFTFSSPGAYSGGRFDPLDPEVGHLYAADTLQGAVAETILRDMPLIGAGERIVPFARVAGRTVSILELQRDLRLVALHGPHAAVIGQGLWLTKCDACDYPLTREWARALRTCAQERAGLVWRARFDEDRLSLVLYSDRAEDALQVVRTLPIDQGPGLEAVRRVLLDHGAVIEH